MRLKYYVEMKDTNNNDDWSNKVDIYGYENEVLVCAMGYTKKYATNNTKETIQQVNDIVNKLIPEGFIVINREDKTA